MERPPLYATGYKHELEETDMLSVEFRMKLQNAVQFLSAHRSGFVPKRNNVATPTHMRRQNGDHDKLMIANPSTWEQHSATSAQDLGWKKNGKSNFPARSLVGLCRLESKNTGIDVLAARSQSVAHQQELVGRDFAALLPIANGG
jgi:hypothetical protein